jgi:sugar phosphate isomerase/epimerase
MYSLTMLTEIMGTNTEAAVSRLSSLGINELDLKGDVFGRQIEDLDEPRRERLAELVDRTGARVHCFSSSLGSEDVGTVGERAYRERLERGVVNLLETLDYVRPRLVRLLGCGAAGRASDPLETLDKSAPWIYDAYREAIGALAGARVGVTIENEPESILSEPAAVPAFFNRLDLPDEVGFTWDVQNMWAAGTFPTIAVYEQLQPLIDYVHLKGGRGSPAAPRTLVYRAPLEDAAWPVAELVGRVLLDGVSPVLCINPSGGATPESYSYGGEDRPGMWAAEAIADVDYLRRTFKSIA